MAPYCLMDLQSDVSVHGNIGCKMRSELNTHWANPLIRLGACCMLDDQLTIPRLLYMCVRGPSWRVLGRPRDEEGIGMSPGCWTGAPRHHHGRPDTTPRRLSTHRSRTSAPMAATMEPGQCACSVRAWHAAAARAKSLKLRPRHELPGALWSCGLSDTPAHLASTPLHQARAGLHQRFHILSCRGAFPGAVRSNWPAGACPAAAACGAFRGTGARGMPATER